MQLVKLLNNVRTWPTFTNPYFFEITSATSGPPVILTAQWFVYNLIWTHWSPIPRKSAYGKRVVGVIFR